MPLSEFDIIARYFTRPPKRADVVLGGGDDCALLKVPAGQLLAVTLDTLVAGRHFPLSTPARAVGHKSLAVSLSDLAAMGAEPAWATLSLSLPKVDEAWLGEFAEGLFDLADRFGVELVGGDTVSGPLVITLQLHGLVSADSALTRSGARPGDGIYVTGTLGDAGAGLGLVQQRLSGGDAEAAEWLIERLNFPAPRVAQGQALRGIATAAIDISDGLAADLGHILQASGVGARIQTDHLPLSPQLTQLLTDEQALAQALGAGDDYELCFTVAQEQEQESRLAALAVPVTRIGVIEAAPGLRFLDGSGNPVLPEHLGFDHFKAE